MLKTKTFPTFKYSNIVFTMLINVKMPTLVGEKKRKKKEWVKNKISAETCDFQQCGILKSVDSDEPVQPPIVLRNSKSCSVSSLTVVEFQVTSKGSDQTARMHRLI